MWGEKNEKSGRIPCSRREVNLSKMCWQRRPDARDRQDKCSSFKSGGFVWVYHLLSPSSDTTDILPGGIHGGPGGERRIQSVKVIF